MFFIQVVSKTVKSIARLHFKNWRLRTLYDMTPALMIVYLAVMKMASTGRCSCARCWYRSMLKTWFHAISLDTTSFNPSWIYGSFNLPIRSVRNLFKSAIAFPIHLFPIHLFQSGIGLKLVKIQFLIFLSLSLCVVQRLRIPLFIPSIQFRLGTIWITDTISSSSIISYYEDGRIFPTNWQSSSV